MLRVAQDELGDPDALRLADRLAQQRVRALAALRWHEVVRRLEKPIVDLVDALTKSTMSTVRVFSSAAALKSSFVTTTKWPFWYS